MVLFPQSYVESKDGTDLLPPSCSHRASPESGRALSAKSNAGSLRASVRMALSLKLARLLLATRAGLALFLPTEKRVKRGFELDEGWGILDIWYGWVWRGYKGGGLRNASETGDEGVGVFVRPGPGSEGGQVVSRERRAGRWKHEERGRVESRPESQTRAKKSGKRGGEGQGGLDAMMRELYMFYGAKDPSSTPPFVGVTAVPRRAAVNPAHAPHRSAHPITAAAASAGPRNASPVPRIRSVHPPTVPVAAFRRSSSRPPARPRSVRTKPCPADNASCCEPPRAQRWAHPCIIIDLHTHQAHIIFRTAPSESRSLTPLLSASLHTCAP